MSRRWLTCVVLIAVTAFSTAGCSSMWHDLQPHRLHRLNRQPAPMKDPEFSATSAAGGLCRGTTGLSMDHPFGGVS